MDEITKILTELEPDEEVRIWKDTRYNVITIRVTGESKSEKYTREDCILVKELEHCDIGLLVHTLQRSIREVRRAKNND